LMHTSDTNTGTMKLGNKYDIVKLSLIQGC
jgi:hypothetical protein